jgi:hypothetical protein
MKVYIRDLSSLSTGTGPRVRFSVTTVDDDGEPAITTKGWTIDRSRFIRPPATRGSGGRFYSIGEISDKWVEKLKVALESLPEVQDILGPQVEGVTNAGNEKIEGVFEIS